jgi:hypothetical protein
VRAEARRPEDAEAGQEELKHRPNQEEPGNTPEALEGRSSYLSRSFAGGPLLTSRLIGVSECNIEVLQHGVLLGNTLYVTDSKQVRSTLFSVAM